VIDKALLDHVLYIDFAEASDYARITETYDAIIHVASLSEGSPVELMQATGLSAWHLLKRAEVTGTKTLVHVSSMSVYGEPQDSPVSALSPILHTTPYGAAKWAAECFLSSCAKNVRCVSVRAPAIVGRRSHRHFLARTLELMKLQSPNVPVSNPDFMFNNIIHESTLAWFLISLIAPTPPSFIAMPVASIEPIPLREIVSELALAVSYQGCIDWTPSTRRPFSIDSGLALSLGLPPISTRDTLNLWLADIRQE
jgi:UDP-glucose 4-epimerase